MVCHHGHIACLVALANSVEAADAYRGKDRSWNCYELGNSVRSLVNI
jgi:hypothetical protein